MTHPFGPSKYRGQPCTREQIIAYCFVQTSGLATPVELTVFVFDSLYLKALDMLSGAVSVGLVFRRTFLDAFWEDV